MDERDDIRTFVLRFLAETAGPSHPQVSEIGDDFDLIASGLFDSMAYMRLIASIEESFALEIDFSDIEPEEMVRVGGIVAAAARARRPDPTH